MKAQTAAGRRGRADVDLDGTTASLHLDSDDRVALAAVLGLAFLIRFLVARLSPNMLWPDEIFQTVEQGHRIFLGSGITPWEFQSAVRNWVMPGLLGLVMWATRWLGTGSTGYMTVIDAMMSALSLLPVYVAYRWARRDFGTIAAVVAAAVAAVWFELVFFAPKTLSEAASAWIVVYALYRGWVARQDPTVRRWVVFGALAGCVVGLRMQLVLAIGLAMIVLCRSGVRRCWLPTLAGFAAVIVAFGLVDLATWGVPFESFYQNYRFNIVEGVAAQFGTSPWRHYVDVMWGVWSFAAFGLIGLALLAGRKYFWLVAVAAVVFITHSIPVHKEYRFVIAGTTLLVVLAGVGLGRTVARLRSQRWAAASIAGVALCVVVVVSAVLATRFTPAATRSIPLAGVDVNHFGVRRGALQAFGYLSQRDDICGVQIVGSSWDRSGGYTWLDHDVPVYFSLTPSRSVPTGVNAIVVDAGGGQRPPSNWISERNFDGIRVYVDPGDCTPAAGGAETPGSIGSVQK